jgi:hypothetical protein
MPGLERLANAKRVSRHSYLPGREEQMMFASNCSKSNKGEHGRMLGCFAGMLGCFAGKKRTPVLGIRHAQCQGSEPAMMDCRPR